MSLFNITLPYLIAIFIMVLPVPVFACDGWSKSVGTKYANICYSNDKGLQRFTKGIGKGNSFFSNGQEKDPAEAGKKVDLLVERVNRLLDMYPFDLQFNIYVYQNHRDIENAYTRMTALGVFGRVPVAFYSHKSRTIYVSVENISAGILAHEIAHAVINFYFPEPPPERMQEILAQYVDKHLWE